MSDVESGLDKACGELLVLAYDARNQQPGHTWTPGCLIVHECASCAHEDSGSARCKPCHTMRTCAWEKKCDRDVITSNNGDKMNTNGDNMTTNYRCETPEGEYVDRISEACEFAREHGLETIINEEWTEYPEGALRFTDGFEDRPCVIVEVRGEDDGGERIGIIWDEDPDEV